MASGRFLGLNDKKPGILFVAYIAIIIVFNGCEYSFDPLFPNDTLHYSIYGTLDASVDSQIIRVGPVRTTILTSPDPIDATVTLEHLGSGAMVTLKDSLYQYGEASWAWNYITDMDIEPRESYRLTATGSGGKSSYVTTTIPDEYSLPRYSVVCFQNRPATVGMFINDVDQLVELNVFYYYMYVEENIIRSVFIRHLEHISDVSGGGQNLVFNIQEDLEQIAETKQIARNTIIPVKYEVFMVSAGPDWPIAAGVNIEELMLPGEARNVENGLGLMVGIVSKTFELHHDCLLPQEYFNEAYKLLEQYGIRQPGLVSSERAEFRGDYITWCGEKCGKWSGVNGWYCQQKF